MLITVDVAGALAAGGLKGYVYLVDTNGYLGSWQEGDGDLVTVCQDGQHVTWGIVSVDPGDDVIIAGFSGLLVDQKVCVPAQDPYQGKFLWNGQIEARGEFASYAYTVMVGMSGQMLPFPASVKVV